MNFNKFFSELKRRNVYKVAIAYTITSWLVAQLASLAADSFGAPAWVIKMIIVVLLIGFPIAFILAWAFEMSPQGMIRTSSEAATDNPYSSRKKKPFTSNLFIGVLALIIIGQFIYNKYSIKNKEQTNVFDKSIAVLPFDDMSSTGDTQWFCDGVTEDILTNLSKIKSLKVISRTSTERYKNTDKSIPEIAKELGVSYILEGSVRKHENKVIITAQLIDANDKHLWAENYNDDFKEVFKIQQDVSKKIVEQLHIVISPEEEKAMESYPTDNMEAYENVLQGRNLIDKFTVESYEGGIEHYQKAIALDPNYTDAYAELAYAYIINPNGNVAENDEKAEEYIEIALKLDPNSSRANSTKGLILYQKNLASEFDEALAQKYFEKALEISPNDSRAHLEYAIYYRGVLKNLDKSLIHINKAVALDPFSMDTNRFQIFILVDNKKIKEAEDYLATKRSLFSELNLNQLENYIINEKVDIYVKEKEDRSQALAIYLDEIKKNPSNPYLYTQMAGLYDGILNDDVTSIKYYKQAYALDSTGANMARGYFSALVENKQFEEANSLYNTENYKNITTEYQKLLALAYINYQQGNYKMVQEIIKDTLFRNQYSYKLMVYAQLGEKEKVYEIFETQNISDTQKAFMYAILKEKDSMYVYMNKEDVNYDGINSRSEFDPYRKEERYKAFLKKNYLPITHWNE